MSIPCKRCLLDEAGMSAEYEDVQSFINVLPEAQKVSEETYNSRLKACRGCEHLREGTCVKCGCYVEMRAIKRRMSCPNEVDRWADIV